jgi:hypothetical protein
VAATGPAVAVLAGVGGAGARMQLVAGHRRGVVNVDEGACSHMSSTSPQFVRVAL